MKPNQWIVEKKYVETAPRFRGLKGLLCWRASGSKTRGTIVQDVRFLASIFSVMLNYKFYGAP